MNTKILLLLSTCCTTLLIASTAALAENFIQINEDGVFVESRGSGVNITGNGVFVRSSGSGGININNSATSTTQPYSRSLQRQQTTISLNGQPQSATYFEH